MTVQITVFGIVQGVGFRPFIALMAEEMQISGSVLNRCGLVEITASAGKDTIKAFVSRLQSNPPKGAVIEKLEVHEIAPLPFDGFHILTSTHFHPETPLLIPDLPLCDDCRKELFDHNNPRYEYPFISCVACGPRYSIIKDIPYDRPTTSMVDFRLCEDCKQEYYAKNDRRRHAQTISCHHCGPQLILSVKTGQYEKSEALTKAIALIKSGKVVAIKGIGGYQFACLPTDSRAVSRLRMLKRRDKKPFAVMFEDIDQVKKFCYVNQKEAELLSSPAAPIVLCAKKNAPFCTEVGAESRFIGAILAHNPLQLLLVHTCGALVMTSGNLSSDPIITADEEMLGLGSPYLDGILFHKRGIVTPLDDSVARVVCGRPQLIRRSRGYVPLPIETDQPADKPILAMGGDLKSCFCLLSGTRAYLSQYFGDTENYKVLKLYQDTLTRMKALFKIEPQVIACDLHPFYQTSLFAGQLAQTTGKNLIRIQHHHAHAASVMAEHGLTHCIAAVFDGTGYGIDGTVWGGEFLLCSGADFTRAAHLKPVLLVGGDSAAENARRTALGYLANADVQPDNDEFRMICAALENRINTCAYSSMGRLFDAVCAVLEIKDRNTYEGECAIALENLAAEFLAGGGVAYPLQFAVESDSTIIIDQVSLLKEIYFAFKNGAPRGALALGFHEAVALAVRQVCEILRNKTNENSVALSGGVFGNLLLTTRCVSLLEDSGFKVFLNEKVPTNDGGISLGQAWLCNRMQQGEKYNVCGNSGQGISG